jgi:alkaline phosphatase
MPKISWFACVVACVFVASAAQAVELKNVIFFIGDGMGFEQVKAGGMYLNGAAGTLSFESFSYQGEITTAPAGGGVTDSAAAGTALATGYKVNNGVISMAIPANGDYALNDELPTLLEYYKDRGRSTGLVTTTYVTHATPAAFGAHETSRGNTTQIATDYMNDSKPNVLLGGGGNGMTSAGAIAAGYTVITNEAEMNTISTETTTMLSGQFGSGHMPYEYDGLGALPQLSEMTSTAMSILDNDPDGFFLMIEGGRIDHAGHASNIERNIRETAEFSNSVQVAINWAAGRSDTLIIVTADHETGGLIVLDNNGSGLAPTVSWNSGGSHTGVNVPVYAWGINADQISGIMDNTDLFTVATAEPALLEGDANHDGVVSAGDYASVQGNFGNTGELDILGDADGDGVVSAGDYASVQANFGNVAVTTEVTPEPCSLGLLSLSCLVLLKTRRQR